MRTIRYSRICSVEPRLSSPCGKRKPPKAVRSVEQETPEGGAERFEDIARKVECHVHKTYRANTCEARDAENQSADIKAGATLLEEFGKTSLSGIYLKDPPVRVPIGSSDIWLKEGAVPVVQHPYRMEGDRGEAWGELVDNARKNNKLEPSTGAWNLPTFPVAKKTPGKYRLVQDV